jgi:hypothetical protein
MSSFAFLYQWISLAALLVTAVAALWRGGWPERVAALAMVGAWFATGFVHNALQMWGVQAGVMLVDIALLLVLLFVALRSDRWWPLWACAFHGLNVVLHFAVMADSKVWGLAYFRASSVFSYLTMLALFVGAVSPRRTPRPT